MNLMPMEIENRIRCVRRVMPGLEGLRVVRTVFWSVKDGCDVPVPCAPLPFPLLEVLRIAPSAVLFHRGKFFSAVPVLVEQVIRQLLDLGTRDEQRARDFP